MLKKIRQKKQFLKPHSFVG